MEASSSNSNSSNHGGGDGSLSNDSSMSESVVSIESAESILSNIPGALFSSLVHDGGLSLPADFDSTWLSSEISRLNHQLHAVDTVLTNKVRSSYGAVNEALQVISSLSDRARDGRIKAREGREDLSRACGKGESLRVVWMERRGRRERTLMGIMVVVRRAREAMEKARQEMKEGRSGECLKWLDVATKDALVVDEEERKDDKTKQQQQNNSNNSNNNNNNNNRYNYDKLECVKRLREEAARLREEAVESLRSGEGYLKELRDETAWDEGKFRRHMEAMDQAGQELGGQGARVQVVHRTLLKNVDRVVGGEQTEMKVDKMKEKMASIVDAKEYMKAVLLCCRQVCTAMRLQVMITKTMPRAEQQACVQLRPKFWGELCRRLSAVLASRAVYTLNPSQVVLWYRAACLALEVGRKFSQDDTHHSKLQRSVQGVLARYVRHVHTNNIIKLRDSLCSDTWATLAPIKVHPLHMPQAPGVFDPVVHIPLQNEWKNPFENIEALLQDAQQSGSSIDKGKQDAVDEEEDEALLMTHVEEGDEPRTTGGGSVGGGDKDNGEGDDTSRGNAVARVCVEMVEQYSLLMDALPPQAAQAALRCCQSMWRYVLLSVWSFFVEGFTVSCSDTMSATLQEAKRLLQEGQPQDSSILGDLFGVGDNLTLSSASSSSNTNKGAAVQAVRRKEGDDADVDYRISAAQLSPQCDQQSPATVWGVQSRVVAAESVVCVSRALETTKGRGGGEGREWRKFWEQELPLAHEIRDVLLERSAIPVVMPAELQRASMSFPMWWEGDSNAAVPTIAPYLTETVRRMRTLQAMVKREGLSSTVQHSIWSYTIACAMQALLQGWSQAKKCDDNGRALMLAHLSSFAVECGKMTTLRPLPWHDRVRAYLQAYYEKDLVVDNWIQHFHFQYDEPMLVALVNVACVKMTRKDKQNALARIKQWKGNA